MDFNFINTRVTSTRYWYRYCTPGTTSTTVEYIHSCRMDYCHLNYWTIGPVGYKIAPKLSYKILESVVSSAGNNSGSDRGKLFSKKFCFVIFFNNLFHTVRLSELKT